MSHKKGMLGRRFKAVSAAMIMGLLATVFVAAPGSAQEDGPESLEPAPQIVEGSTGGGGTGAEVGGAPGGTAPYIECAFAVVDATRSADDWIIHGQDDAPGIRPAETPCTADGDESAKQPTYGSYPHIQVAPNPHDMPNQRWIELWAAIDSNNHPGTIAYWDVYHNVQDPEAPKQEDFKVQVDGTSLGHRVCDVDTLAASTYVTGQATEEAWANMFVECETQRKQFYYGAFNLSKHQPHGWYTVILTTSLAGGGRAHMVYYIEVLPFVHLVKDFNGVGFGDIQQNNHYVQLCHGDYVFNDFSGPSPECDQNAGNEPSIKNWGNAGMRVDVAFRHMCLQGAPSCTNLKRIDLFDAALGIAPRGLTRIGECAPGQDPNTCGLPSSDVGDPWIPHSFPLNRGTLLCPNDEAKIEFSIYVEQIDNGTYDGAYALIGKPDFVIPDEDGERYRCETDRFHFGNAGAVYPRAYSGGEQLGDIAPATQAAVGYYAI